MKYRTLGKSGIKVSEIGFGAWTIGLDWWGKKIDDDEAIRMLKRAYDLGINFFETADIYGKGKSEKLIAQVFKDMRNDLVYSTKWGYDMYSAKQVGHSELPQKHNQEFLQFAIGQSLDRLQTDYIDVYSLHNPKMDAIENDKLFASIDYMVKKGTIKSHRVEGRRLGSYRKKEHYMPPDCLQYFGAGPCTRLYASSRAVQCRHNGKSS